MNELDLFRVAWWKWWGNPMLGIHADHVSSLPFVDIASAADITDYFKLIQVRSHFELPDVPDQAATSNHSILAATLARPDQISAHLTNLAVLTLSSGIIHARPAEWQAKYGVESADEIRKIIEHFRAIPQALSTWHHCAPAHLPEESNFGLEQRAVLGLGVFLRTFFPSIYQRWALTQSYDLLKAVKQLEPFRDIHWNEIMAWLEAGFTSLSDEITAAYQEAKIELNENEIEEFTPLDIDALYGVHDA
ncbi:MAG TPA: hypothetical protein VFV39_01935 [Limnobacter sp.]|nr:hypothetical protein [Limnobacter sp.]